MSSVRAARDPQKARCSGEWLRRLDGDGHLVVGAAYDLVRMCRLVPTA